MELIQKNQNFVGNEYLQKRIEMLENHIAQR